MKLPSLNDYTLACRANKYRANKMKREVEDGIGWFIGKIPKIQKPVRVHFLWVEKDERRDPDNIAFAKKFILDALVRRGKLKDDNRKCVIGFTDSFETGKEYKVVLYIEEEQ